MSARSLFPRTARALLVAAMVLTAGAAPCAQERKAAPARATPGASRPAPPTAEAERQRRLRGEQKELQARLLRLKQQLAAAEASHSEATDALRESERAISAATRRLHELAQARRSVEQQIAGLQQRGRATAQQQGDEERQLGRILALQYALGRQAPWQAMLAGRSPQQPALDDIYLSYLARDKAQLIDALAERRVELEALQAESQDKQAELAEIARDEERQRGELLRQQQARRQTLDRLARRIGEQRQSIAGLERDERRLTGLIEEIGKLLAQQQRAREQRERERRAQRNTPPPPPANRPARPPVEPEGPNDGPLAQMRGKLVLPVKGEVTARFGSPRRTEAGVNAPTWKGVFIRSTAGEPVHAVAAGRVVFADWLRGFGNLMILDHGEGVLSVYGSNETLLANLGDKVEAGQSIATVGSTGGNTEAGLYFELRLQGRPIDPLRWAAAR